MLAAHSNRFHWMAPEHLHHLTLHVLGEISTPAIGCVIEAAREAAASTKSFSITLAGLDGFPSLGAARVVWIGVRSGARQLVELAGTLDRALRRRQMAHDRRPFTPHLTLGRLRTDAPAADLEQVAESRDISLGDQPVADIVVMEDVLGRLGFSYRAVARVALGNARAAGMQPGPLDNQT